ncbi:MAG TPA: hypothetical protein VEK15_20450 [Vicinamibacteria bacterium]|nr:hypothetical protein [Vicinamibacteria bacterium]
MHATLASLTSRGASVFWLALLVAIGVAVTREPRSETARVSNLYLVPGAFPDTYLMLSKTDEGRGHLLARRDSSFRRGRENVPGKGWYVDRFGAAPDEGIPDHWLLRSKRQGTMILVPVEAVEDWTYPFVYELVSRQFPQLALPWATWTELFVNRVYRGLHLRVSLPFDPRKKDGGSGILRELVTVRGDALTAVDTRFNPDARLYIDLIAESRFPRVAPPPPVLAWLESRRPFDETLFLLSNVEPFDLSLFPLPVSLEELAHKLHRTPLRTVQDERHRSLATGDTSNPPPFDEEWLDDAFQNYRERFCSALKSHHAAQDKPMSPANGEICSDG